MQNFILSESDYKEIVTQFKTLLKEEIHSRTASFNIPEYNDFFTAKGNWDKRKKYFDITVKFFKHSQKTENPIKEIGSALLKIGEFVENNNNEKIYMQCEFKTASYYDNGLEVRIKFVSYSMAAKLLLSQ